MIGLRVGPLHLRMISVVLAGVALLSGMLVVVPGNSSADFPKTIDGHVFEGSHSYPVANAVVTVNTYGSGHSFRKTATDPSTDSSGMYYVSISDDWTLVETIEVTATYGVSNQKTVSVDDNGNPYSQHIDVPFPYAIPQLVGMASVFAAVAAVGAVAIVTLRARRI